MISINVYLKKLLYVQWKYSEINVNLHWWCIQTIYPVKGLQILTKSSALSELSIIETMNSKCQQYTVLNRRVLL